jgi:hypothetical protein
MITDLSVCFRALFVGEETVPASVGQVEDEVTRRPPEVNATLDGRT